MVIWDAVVPSKDASRINIVDAVNRYPLIDQSTHLRGANVSLVMKWDIMPLTGFLYMGTTRGSTARESGAGPATATVAVAGTPADNSVVFPSDYCSDSSCALRRADNSLPPLAALPDGALSSGGAGAGLQAGAIDASGDVFLQEQQLAS